LAGSFCNVAGIRLPVGKSVVRPRSSCMGCGTPLSALELIPVFSWLLAAGKCRHCKQPISPLYLLGELAAGLLFAFLPYAVKGNGELLLAYPLALLLLILTVADLKYRLLPNKLLYPALLFFFVLRLFLHPLPYFQYAAGFLLGGGSLLLVSWLFALRGKDGLGGGDIKLMALMGMVLGVKLVFICVFLSALLGVAAGGVLLLAGRLKKEEAYLPYGPFIAAAGLFALCYGEALASWYMALF
jgi:leader peptidase (prepilin peptidase) / N-methyltransferase